MGTYQSKFTGAEIDGLLEEVRNGGGGSASTREYGMFYYKQTGTNSSRTELLPTEHATAGYLGTGLTNMGQDEQGRPILKKGKIYKFTVITGEIYFSSANGHYYATVALNENYRVLTATIMPTTFSTNYAPALRRETGLAKIEEDTSLKVYDGWTGGSSDIKSADFYVLVEEVSGGGSSSGTKKVTLWEGSCRIDYTSLELNESIENFDFILVECCCNPTGKANTSQATATVNISSLGYIPQSDIDENYTATNTYNVFSAKDTAGWYRVLFGFVDNTHLFACTFKGAGTWINPQISRVTGIKF